MNYQSYDLSCFYQSIYQWIEEGCPQHPAFTTDRAICINLWRWAKICAGLSRDRATTLDEELTRQFKVAGLDPTIPFNMHSATYAEERDTRTLYENPRRLKWIKNHAI